ncbi:MAG: hypothetical protein Phyf2KO_11590 [Phycisphaerales bacterium]
MCPMTKFHSPKLVLLIVASHLCHFAVSADELHVPGDYSTIQAAINAVVEGDEVVIAPGVYREALSVLSGKSLTIRSSDPSDPSVVSTTILSGDIDDDGMGDSQILLVEMPDSSNITIEGLTFTDGFSSLNGGAIELGFTVNSQIRIEDCVFEANEAIEDGGAVYFGGRSTLMLSRNTFIGNRSGSQGGAVHSFGQLDVVDRCGFYGNKSNFGILSLCGTILSNRYPANVSNCEFVGNVLGDSSALAVCARDIEIEGCTFAENYAGSGEGTAVTMHLVASSFGILVASRVNISNSIIAPRRDQLPFNSFGNIYFDVSDSIALPFWEGARVINADPMFVRYPSDGGDGWGDDPLTSQIDESANDDYGDLRLKLSSPAIDAGNNDTILADILDQDADGDVDENSPLDFLGASRQVDTPTVTDSGLGDAPLVDMGANEYQPTECVADVNGDGQLTPADFTAWIDAFNNNLPDCDQNNDATCSPADFTAWIINYNSGCNI